MRLCPFIIILGSGLFLRVDAACYLWSERLEEYGEIEKTFKKVSKTIQEKQATAKSHLPHRKFNYFEFVKICPSPFAEAIVPYLVPEPLFLGKGAFGVVFGVNVNGSIKAVKQINPKKIIERKLRKLFHLDENTQEKEERVKQRLSEGSDKPPRAFFREEKSNQLFSIAENSEPSKEKFSVLPEQMGITFNPDFNDQSADPDLQKETNEIKTKCLQSILERLDDPRIFISDPKNIRKDNKKTLSIVNFDLFKTEACQVAFPDPSRILLTISKTFEALRSELEVNQILSNYSHQIEKDAKYKSFPSYEQCIIGKRFDIFIIGEKLGINLADVRKGCAIAVQRDSLEARLKTYISMLYQVFKLNQLGYAHCDIKLENLLYEPGDFTRVHLIDFGLVKYKTNCRGGTAGYKPPEMYVSDIQLEELDLNYGTPEYQKHDVFSAGIAILMMELPYDYAAMLLGMTHNIEQLTIETIENAFTAFQNFSGRVLSIEYNRRYRDQESQQSLTAKLDMEVGNLISQMTIYFPSMRVPLPLALFLMHKIYKALIGNDTNFGLYEDYFANPEKTREEIEKGSWIIEVQELLEVNHSKVII